MIVVVGVAVVVVHVAVWDEATGSSLSRITGGRSSTYYILLLNTTVVLDRKSKYPRTDDGIQHIENIYTYLSSIHSSTSSTVDVDTP